MVMLMLMIAADVCDVSWTTSAHTAFLLGTSGAVVGKPWLWGPWRAALPRTPRPGRRGARSFRLNHAAPRRNGRPECGADSASEPRAVPTPRAVCVRVTLRVSEPGTPASPHASPASATGQPLSWVWVRVSVRVHDCVHVSVCLGVCTTVCVCICACECICVLRTHLCWRV